jgi:hypothetical protein
MYVASTEGCNVLETVEQTRCSLLRQFIQNGDLQQ